MLLIGAEAERGKLAVIVYKNEIIQQSVMDNYSVFVRALGKGIPMKPRFQI